MHDVSFMTYDGTLIKVSKPCHKLFNIMTTSAEPAAAVKMSRTDFKFNFIICVVLIENTGIFFIKHFFSPIHNRYVQRAATQSFVYVL